MDAGQAWQPGSPPGAVSGRGTVLIVEDSPESAALVSAVLEEEGFTPVVRSDGHSGMRSRPFIPAHVARQGSPVGLRRVLVWALGAPALPHPTWAV